MTKQELRNYIKDLSSKNFSDPNFRTEQSFRICEKISVLPEFQKAQAVLVYMPLADELNTLPIVSELFLSGRRIAIPKVNPETGSMDFYWITPESKLNKGAFGILEPADYDVMCNFSEVYGNVLVIVPGRAFTEDGKRLGRGKGFYDKFLSGTGKKFTKLGVCFPFQIVDDIPVEENDVLMDSVIF